MSDLKLNRAAVLSYAAEKYGSSPDFPWQKYPKYAVLRQKSTDNAHKAKWYALIMNISLRKLGLNSDEVVDVLNVKCAPEILGSFIDHKLYFPAYHMNKEHWLTILLTERAAASDIQNIFNLIDMSYNLVYHHNSQTAELAP